MRNLLHDRQRRIVPILLFGLVFSFGHRSSLHAQLWDQFGGPNRNFRVESGSLSASWPPEGPRQLWQRELGDGYSQVLYEQGRLYAFCRRGERDVVVSLNADDGEVLWETSYDAPLLPNQIAEFGPGPIATPALVGQRLFTYGATAKFHCLDKNSGRIIWSKDFAGEMDRGVGRGAGASPVAFGDLVIQLVGGRDRAVVAMDQATGEERWRSPHYSEGYSSPLIGRVGSHDLLIVAEGTVPSQISNPLATRNRTALDPRSGELIWKVPISGGDYTMSILDLGQDNLLFGSSAYDGGTRVIRIRESDEGSLQAELLWSTRKMRIAFGSYVRLGDHVYGSSGNYGPTLLIAIHVKTGKIAWRKRGFARASLLAADGKVLILDEEGSLAIATPSPDDLVIHSRARVMERISWTTPTLAGTRLFIRNRKTIKGLQLGLENPRAAAASRREEK